MKLKNISEYYDERLNKCLRDGDNDYIKKYTTEYEYYDEIRNEKVKVKFKRAYEMWEEYPHDSIESFFEAFKKDYNSEFLVKNCERCYEEMRENGSEIGKDELFDILIRRLVIDTFIGFNCEETIKDEFVRRGVSIHNYDIVSKDDERKLDDKYGVDIITFNGDEITHFIQVKNNTFLSNRNYMMDKRKKFFDKERKANEYVDDNKTRYLLFYIYDRGEFIKGNGYRFYVNPRTNKLNFRLDELVNEDGSLKVRLRDLKTDTFSNYI